jgi:hypothetical protein
VSDDDDTPRWERPDDPLWAGRREKPEEREPERRFDAGSRAGEQVPYDPAGTAPRVDRNRLVPQRRLGGPPAIEPPSGVVTPPDEGSGDGGGAVAVRDSEPPFAARFQFLLGALLALGVLAVGVLAYGLTSGGTDSGSASWSPWKPSDNGMEGAQQIADHVGPQYRLQSGEQLVLLVGGELEVADLPATIAMRNTEGDVSLVEGDGVLYKMCGLGPKCSIATGKPSEERHLLLRREALELALYSFRYLDGVDQVVVLMPPRTVKQADGSKVALDPDQALFFRKGDVTQELHTQLRATLPAPPPSIAKVARARDAALVNRLTTHGLFNFRYAQAQDTQVYLVLEPFGSAPAQTTPGPAAGAAAGTTGSAGGSVAGATGGTTGSAGATGSGSGASGSSGGSSPQTPKQQSSPGEKKPK